MRLNFSLLHQLQLPCIYFILECCRWFHGKIPRQKAERIITSTNDPGAFLIRESESKPGDYSLSVRDGENVKHYRIRTLDEGGYYIARRVTFKDLAELVQHYREGSDGLCTRLNKPAKHIEMPGKSVHVIILFVRDAVCLVSSVLEPVFGICGSPIADCDVYYQ